VAGSKETEPGRLREDLEVERRTMTTHSYVIPSVREVLDALLDLEFDGTENAYEDSTVPPRYLENLTEEMRAAYGERLAAAAMVLNPRLVVAPTDLLDWLNTGEEKTESE
jgi:hypothetical protein